MDNICLAENISYSYHTKLNEIKVFDNLSFSIKEKELLGLIGPSGCGKSTILSLLARLISPQHGKITFFGKDNNINYTGYMLQKDELFPWRNVMSNILLGNEITKHKDKSYAVNLLKKYNLYDFKKSYPDELSGGMRQRVALIRTLNLNPKILLLDEPFSALDYQNRLNLVEDVYRIIKQEQKTAVLVTHDIQEALSFCDRILILKNRPSNVEKEYDLSFFSDMYPSARRKDHRFLSSFDAIFECLKNLERKNE